MKELQTPEVGFLGSLLAENKSQLFTFFDSKRSVHTPDVFLPFPLLGSPLDIFCHFYLQY
jgi:hypothetical protein